MTNIDDVVLNFSPASMSLLNVILCVVMFSIALDLRLGDFREITRNPKAFLVGVASQFVALPALTFALVWVLEPRPSIALGLMLVAACPGGNISNFLTHRARGNLALSVSMTAFAIAICPLATPFNIAFWGSLSPPMGLITWIRKKRNIWIASWRCWKWKRRIKNCWRRLSACRKA